MQEYKELLREIKGLYLNDRRPWIVGFSGGKDSTSVLQLIFMMLKALPADKRRKKVHVLSSDTLVESPYIQSRIIKSCNRIRTQAKKDELPIDVKILKPDINDSFWVNLIGRGYPSPNKWFRWCTDRLKIRPMTKYTLEQVKKNGEVIIILGARRDESGSRAHTLNKYSIKDFKLRKHSGLTGAYLYTPIEDWGFEDVWIFLLQVNSPWGDSNKGLLNLYRKSDQECPLVVDDKTPPCGSGRFGCWVCTVVERDRALEGLIEEGEEWLEPLLEFRNWLKKIRDESKYREPVRKIERRKKQIAEYFGKDFMKSEHRGHQILGPFTLETRHEILKRLLTLQEIYRERGIKLITGEEIKAIEILWTYEGDYITSVLDVLENKPGSGNNYVRYKDLMSRVCEENDISRELVERLLIVEEDFSRLSRRTGIFSRIEKVLEETIQRGDTLE